MQEQPSNPPVPQSSSQPIVMRQGNGLAVASLVLGIVGAVLGLIPLAAFVAIICGVLAVVFGQLSLDSTYRIA